MSLYPSFDALIDSGKEEGLLEVHKSLRSELSNMCLFLFCVVAVFILNYYLRDLRPPQNIPVVKYLSVRWFSIIPAYLLIELTRKYHDDLYLFDLHRISHYDGMLSLTYQVPNIRYTDIKAITIKQDLFGRILNYGDIELSTAATSECELVMLGVKRPRELVKLLEEFRDHSLNIIGGDSASNESAATSMAVNYALANDD